MSDKLILDNEQKKCIKDILRVKKLCISPDCGFGKTIVGLVAYTQILKLNPKAKMLVACTPSGIKATWSGEHLKFDQLKHLNVTILDGTPKQRLIKLNSDAQIYGVSYNSLKWLAQNATDEWLRDIKFVYADEGSCLKGEKSVWRDQFKLLSSKADYKVISSATPSTKDAMDFFGLCDFMDGGKLLGVENITDFRSKFCKQYVATNRRIAYKIKDSATMLLIEKLCDPLFYSYTSAKHVDIPVKTITVNAKFSDKSQALYDALLKEQCLNSVIRNDEGQILSNESLSSDQVAVKLQQLSSGFIYVDGYCRLDLDELKKIDNVREFITKRKKEVTAYDIFDDRIKLFAKLLEQIEKNHGDMPILIPYHYKHELVQLKKQFPTGTQYRCREHQDAFNNKEIPYLFGQYQTCSMSLNLQYGSNVIAFYSPTFNWGNDYQIIRRLARQLQPEPCVYAYRMYVRGTYDDVKERRLNGRGVNHLRFQNQIRGK